MNTEEKLRHDAATLSRWAKETRGAQLSLLSDTGRSRMRRISAALDAVIRDAAELSGFLVDLANAEAQKAKP